MESTTWRVNVRLVHDTYSGEIYANKFHLGGNLCDRAGFERNISLCDVYCEGDNTSVMTGHTDAIVKLCFSEDGYTIFMTSFDGAL